MWVPAVTCRRLQKVGAEMRYTIATRWTRVRGSRASRIAEIWQVMDIDIDIYIDFPKEPGMSFFRVFMSFVSFQETKNNKHTTTKRKVLPRNSTCFWSEATEKSLTDSVTSRLREETEQSMTQKLQVVTSGGGFLYFSQFVWTLENT